MMSCDYSAIIQVTRASFPALLEHALYRNEADERSHRGAIIPMCDASSSVPILTLVDPNRHPSLHREFPSLI